MIWINGKAGDTCEAVLDDGFWFGRGVFETIRVHDRPLFWHEHIDRLNSGLAALRVRPAVDGDQLLTQLVGLGIVHCVVKIAVTPASIIMQTRPLPAAQPVNFKLFPLASSRDANPHLLQFKSLNYLENLLAREQAAEQGCDDALFVNPEGQLSETSRANIFLVKDGRLLTPDLSCGLLAGVVRQWVLANFPVACVRLTYDDLLSAEAIFVTNSVIGIQPVSAVAERQYAGSDLVSEVRSCYENFIG